ncbi:MAG: hypothetical protein HOY69_06950 [Streptomyces sp.]|nr:hypothetical protein [Streptomyces sp.]
MRRLASVLGSVAAAGALALGFAGSASAATGTLVVSGTEYQNPSGCYNATIWPLQVANRTNEPVLVFTGQNCSGDVLEVVVPGSTVVSEFGASVYVA